MNAIVTQPKFAHTTTTYNNNGIKLGVFQQTNVPVLSDVAVLLFSSVEVLTLNGQCMGCATIAFSEQYGYFI
jgi:hypothetical protein